MTAPFDFVGAFIREKLESIWTEDCILDNQGDPICGSHDTRELLEDDGEIARDNAGVSRIANDVVLEAVTRAIQSTHGMVSL